MNTSCFANYGNSKNGVSIAYSHPLWWSGRVYPALAPPHYLLSKYKASKISKEEYTKQYREKVLSKLNPKEVYEELGENAVLLCWEPPSAFCHRHLVADWLEKELNIEIKEI